MATKVTLDLHASGAESSDGTGAAVDAGALSTVAKLLLDITAITGTLQVTVETSATKQDWSVLRSFESVTAACALALKVYDIKRWLRVTWTLSGTATFQVSGEARDTYCTPADLTVPERALDDVAVELQWDKCIAVSDKFDGDFSRVYALPLTAWDEGTREHVATVVVAHLFRHRGCDPEGADKVVFDAEKQSLAWVARLGGNNGPRPPGIVDSTPVVNEAAAVVVTRPSRGW